VRTRTARFTKVRSSAAQPRRLSLISSAVTSERLILEGQTRPGIKTAYAWVTPYQADVKRLHDAKIQELQRR
jgi:hypothetical protein